MIDPYPKRIICLTEESTEMLYLLGEEKRIAGISGYTRRPKLARKEKPVVSAFIDADLGKIIALQPDLVIGFSDIQAEIAAALIKKGINVWITNQRSVTEIMETMVQLGAMVGRSQEARDCVAKWRVGIDEIKCISTKYILRPKVYFEEWYDPLISGIRWVAELIEFAGGDYIFPEKAKSSLALGRIIADPQEVIDLNPDIIIASWCGKKFKPEKLIARPGWENIAAVRNKQLFEINSTIILQPGPACLTDGLQSLHQIIAEWAIVRA